MKFFAEIDQQRGLMLAGAAEDSAVIVGYRHLTRKVFHQYIGVLDKLAGRVGHPYDTCRGNGCTFYLSLRLHRQHKRSCDSQCGKYKVVHSLQYYFLIVLFLCDNSYEVRYQTRIILICYKVKNYSRINNDGGKGNKKVPFAGNRQTGQSIQY